MWLETNFDESRHDESKALSRDDAKVISIYQNSVKRVGNNYSISLPFKCDYVIMPNNFNAAKRQILNLSQSLVKSPKKLNAYVKFMQQLFIEEHAVILTDEEVIGEVGKIWYLNHHLVHSSGKDRVVFNCSGEFQNISLNSMLFKGPTLENTLLGVFLRFRIFKFALVGDIKKMYYQCFVNQPFQNFMRFLWFLDDSPTGKIIHCKMARLAYGLICSQSGAQFCLQQTVANTEVEISKFTRDLASSSFYVDDFLTSVSSTYELFTVYDEIRKLMHSGGFHLTKFFTNFQELRAKFLPEDCAPSFVQLNFDKRSDVVHKALGMQWNSGTDCISFSICLEKNACTRRGILSTFSQIFDPIGVIEPLLIVPKLLIRTLCKLKLTWDDAIPVEHERTWFRWLECIENLNSLFVDRCLVPSSAFDRIEIHSFSDASSEAYSAVVYLRVLYGTEVKVSFVIGKSKIAPLKQALTIPNLELIAACLSVRLTQKVISELRLKVDRCFYWVDAVCVLHLIQNRSKRFKIFVANRLSLIHHYTQVEDWHYCPTDLNVADLGSRPLFSSEIESLKPWFRGPEFLRFIKDDWPSIDCYDRSQSDVVLSSFLQKMENRTATANLNDLIERYSSFNKLLRAVAYLAKFKSFLLDKLSNVQRTLTTVGFDIARNDLCRFVQLTSFPFLFGYLSGKSVSREHRNTLYSLKKLDPFVDNDGLIRVGGRLQRSSFDFNVKHPILLPKRHPFVKLIVFHYHEFSHHSGYTFVLAQIRQFFWIANGQSSVRFYLKDCFYCSLRRAKAGQQIMSPLPFERAAVGGCFSVVGIDFFGPEWVLIGYGQSSSRRKVKRYGCIFSCFSTRAVHLEVCHSLSTDSFLCALLRFIYCRGHSTKQIWSDNGSNFIGADNEISKSLFLFFFY